MSNHNASQRAGSADQKTRRPQKIRGKIAPLTSVIFRKVQLGDEGDQPESQGDQGGGEGRCQQGSVPRSIGHGGDLSCEKAGGSETARSRESRLNFKGSRPFAGELRTRSRAGSPEFR